MTISVVDDIATAQPTAPTTKITPLISNVTRRPKRCDSQPPPIAPTAAPAIIAATIISWTRSEAWNASAISGNAPEITPMSMPNSKPARAAMGPTM